MIRRIYFFLFFVIFLFGNSIGFAQDENVLSLVPPEHKQDIKRALKSARKNRGELTEAIKALDKPERWGMIFLIANMPLRDLRSLKAEFLIENVRYAYQTRQEMPWGKEIPDEIFFNDVLSYFSVNERRDNWRQDFYNRFSKIAKEAGTIEKAAGQLNLFFLDELKVSYDGVKRPKPDQSPYESMEAHYASCTGLAILAVDVLRSVGIPARFVGIPQWTSGGNHSWIEVWDNGWHYMGAGESTAFDQAWFTDQAAKKSDPHKQRNRIYAVSFKTTDLKFPMVWELQDYSVNAVDVTERYHQPIKSSPQISK